MVFFDLLCKVDYMFEYCVVMVDGNFWWICNKGWVYFNGDIFYCFIGIVQDVMDECCLRDEQQKLFYFVDNSVELMLLLGIDNINLYINKVGMELFGFDMMEEVCCMFILELYFWEDYEKVSEEVIMLFQIIGCWFGIMNVCYLKIGEIILVYNNMVWIDDLDIGEVLVFGVVMCDM